MTENVAVNNKYFAWNRVDRFRVQLLRRCHIISSFYKEIVEKYKKFKNCIAELYAYIITLHSFRGPSLKKNRTIRDHLFLFSYELLNTIYEMCYYLYVIHKYLN